MNPVTFVLLLTAAVLVESEQCKWNRNHLYYGITADSTISGISLASAYNCIRRAFHIYENTLPGYYFNNVEGYLYEEPDFGVIITDFKKLSFESKPSVTRVNCTDGAIQGGTIYLNTNYNYVCKPWFPDTTNNPQSINLFDVTLRGIGYLIGLEENDDPSSIMYRNSDNFEYLQENVALNAADSRRVVEKYL